MAKIIGNPTVTPMAVPDWNQNNPLKADYVKNRPFYKEDVKVNAVELEYSSDDVYVASLEMRLGEVYYVDIIGTDGNLQSYNSTPQPYAEPGNEHWIINIEDMALHIYNDHISIANSFIFQKMQIYRLQTIYHTIPQEYLNLEGMIPEVSLGSGTEIFTINLDAAAGAPISTDKTFDEITVAYNEKQIIQITGMIDIIEHEEDGSMIYITYSGAQATLSGITKDKMWFDFHIDNYLYRLIGKSNNIWRAEQYNLATEEYVDNACNLKIVKMETNDNGELEIEESAQALIDWCATHPKGSIILYKRYETIEMFAKEDIYYLTEYDGADLYFINFNIQDNTYTTLRYSVFPNEGGYYLTINSYPLSGGGGSTEVPQVAPYIGGNGNWYSYSYDGNSFIDTGVKAQGETPIKGTDYWTESDKAEIKAYIDEAILGGAW